MVTKQYMTPAGKKFGFRVSPDEKLFFDDRKPTPVTSERGIEEADNYVAMGFLLCVDAPKPKAAEKPKSSPSS